MDGDAVRRVFVRTSQKRLSPETGWVFRCNLITMTNNSIIEIRNLSFAYSGHPVLEEINLSVREGDFVAMIGPNGGGKTTLLKLMLGLLMPTGGSLEVLGHAPRRVSHRIGYMPQNVHVNTHFPVTALDVVLMGKLTRGKRWNRFSKRDRREAQKALDRLGMGAFCRRRIGALSGGQLQRIFLARALVSEPQLLFLDEPTANIDTRGQAEFYSLLKELNASVTIIVVSHDLLVLSAYVKSVACINRRLHYHDQAEITTDMLESMYPCTPDQPCQVELIAHGLPHRVLGIHGKE